MTRANQTEHSGQIAQPAPGRQYGLLTRVAREAGVSQATVSKVVHGRPDVAPATRARIEALLAESGHVRTGSVPSPTRFYAVFRDLESPYTLEVVRGIVEAAAGHSVGAVIGTLTQRPVADWLEACAEPDILGMVLVISMLTERDQRRIHETGVRAVLIDPISAPLDGVPSIGVTNWRGGYDAVKHLVNLGHRRIGIVAGRRSSPAGGARLHGYRAALQDHGITDDPELVRATDFDFDEAIAACDALLTLPKPPTAIFATSDAQALGVLEAARRRGFAVPEQLSVVSFDDTAAAAMASPPLTAIRQPFEELGQVATRVLLGLGQEPRPVVERYELATSLTLRMSTAPPQSETGPALRGPLPDQASTS